MLYAEIEISPSDWLDWKNNPVTQDILAGLTRERDEWAARLIEGDTLQPGREAVETAKAVGVIYGLDCILVGISEMLKEKWAEGERRKADGNGGGSGKQFY